MLTGLQMSQSCKGLFHFYILSGSSDPGKPKAMRLLRGETPQRIASLCKALVSRNCCSFAWTSEGSLPFAQGCNNFSAFDAKPPSPSQGLFSDRKTMLRKYSMSQPVAGASLWSADGVEIAVTHENDLHQPLVVKHRRPQPLQRVFGGTSARLM